MPILTFLVLGLLTLQPAAAIHIEIRSPTPGTPVFDEIEVLAEVFSEDPVVRVELFVDGRHMGTLTAPPYRFAIDVGEENVERRFQVVAHSVTGEQAVAEVQTFPLDIDLVHEARLQQLYVTVERPGGQRALHLERGGFAVHDMGRRQRIVSFERGDIPLTAALLVDASLSMRGRPLETALRGARIFLDRMAPLDEAMLLLFSDRILHATPFVGDAERLDEGLAGVVAEGGTALNDHLYLALKQLESHQGRRVAILLSDGIDVESVVSVEDLAFLARRSQAMIYWLHLDRKGSLSRVDHYSAWRDAEGHRREYRQLDRLVRATGGRVVPVASLDEVGSAFQEVMAELREQYVLGYYPSERHGPGTWHPVRVSLQGAAAGLRVRTTDGYLEF